MSSGKTIMILSRLRARNQRGCDPSGHPKDGVMYRYKTARALPIGSARAVLMYLPYARDAVMIAME